MPDAETMRALIERVEQASGPDRELDAEIAVATTPGMIRDFEYVGFTGAGDMYPAPAYTASLDAAVSLVPEGWRTYRVERLSADGAWRVSLIKTYGAVGKSVHAEGKTERGARVAAALRARLAGEVGDAS